MQKRSAIILPHDQGREKSELMAAQKRKKRKDKRAKNLPDYQAALNFCFPENLEKVRHWKQKAIQLLQTCLTRNSENYKCYALLAYLYLQDDQINLAEEYIRKALDLEEENPTYLRFFLAVLNEQGKLKQAEKILKKLAFLDGIDLKKMKQELQKEGFDTGTLTLILNTFPNGVGWLESELSDEVMSSSTTQEDPENYRPKKLNPNLMPSELRRLIPLAREWGIGDDVIRGDLGKHASQKQRKELKQILNKKTRIQINSWLDSFGDDSMTDEAACFMYLLEAYEEII